MDGLTHNERACWQNTVHRHNNVVMNCLANDKLAAGIITDSFHLPTAILKTILRAKGSSSAIVVSDISFPGGCEPGTFEWGGEVVKLEPDGYLHMPARACMAVSSATSAGMIALLVWLTAELCLRRGHLAICYNV